MTGEVCDIAITADESCMHNYTLSFMAGFLSCVSRDTLPPAVEYFRETKRQYPVLEKINQNGAYRETPGALPVPVVG